MSRITPVVTVMLDKERHLRFDLNALVDIEEGTGKSLADVFSAGNRIPLKDFRTVLWAGLKAEDPSLTQEQVGALVGAENFTELNDSVDRAFSASQPEPTEGEPKNGASPHANQKAKGARTSSPTGETSGPTDA
jgi:hypothetical protein